MLVELGRDGRVAREPRPTFPGVMTRVGVGTYDGGAAWASASDLSSRVHIRLAPTGGVERTVDVMASGISSKVMIPTIR